MLRHGLYLLKLAGEELSLQKINDILSSTPETVDDRKPIKNKFQDENGDWFEEYELTEWMKNSYCFELINMVHDRIDNKELSPDDELDFEAVKGFWLEEYVKLDDRTRSNIRATYSTMADPFRFGMFRKLFCTTTNIFPEMTDKGLVILLDFPVTEHGQAGTIVQGIFKYVWQKYVERRPKSDGMRPVFLWIDEAQHFINDHDMMFQTTARSS